LSFSFTKTFPVFTGGHVCLHQAYPRENFLSSLAVPPVLMDSHGSPLCFASTHASATVPDRQRCSKCPVITSTILVSKFLTIHEIYIRYGDYPTKN
jgi:hypothetical protein